MSVAAQPKIPIDRIRLSSSWTAYLLPVATVPMEEGIRESIGAFVEEVVSLIVEEWKLTQEVFLQTWRLHIGKSGAIIEDNLKTWDPTLGAGVWPDRAPPSRWTEETFMNATAAMLKKQEPQFSSHRLLHIGGDAEARRLAAQKTFGSLIVMQMFSVSPFKELVRRGMDLFLPSIQDRAFRHELFYVPLIEKKSILSATEDQLSAWLCGAEVYIRESAEDKGILFLSRRDLCEFFRIAERRTGGTTTDVPSMP